jgi:hypothetical protein
VDGEGYSGRGGGRDGVGWVDGQGSWREAT